MERIIELLVPPTRFCACWSQKSNRLNFLSALPLWIEIFRTRIICPNTVTSVLGNPGSACNFEIVAGGLFLAHFVLLRKERWMIVCPHAITALCMPDCKSRGFPHEEDQHYFENHAFTKFTKWSNILAASNHIYFWLHAALFWLQPLFAGVAGNCWLTFPFDQ